MATHDVSWSELDALRQCPHKHALGFREKWAPLAPSPALAKGTLMHSVLETHYQSLLSAQGLESAYDRIVPLLHDREGNRSEIQELISWMYAGYLDHYGVDQEWQIVAVEHQAQVWLPTPAGGRSSFRFNMKIDLIVKWKGRLWLVDHKTGKDLPKDDKELALADQFGLYTWGMRQLGRPVHGVIYNALRTQRNKSTFQPLDERFQRIYLYRTDRELTNLAVEAYRDFRAGYRVAADEAPRHPNQEWCRWRCPFTEPCLASRKMKPDAGVFERRMMKDMGFVQDFSSDRGSLTIAYQETE